MRWNFSYSLSPGSFLMNSSKTGLAFVNRLLHLTLARVFCSFLILYHDFAQLC